MEGNATSILSKEQYKLVHGKEFLPFIECEVCGTSNPLHRCSRCRGQYYCSKTCQINHWKLEHKYDCQPISEKKEALLKETNVSVSIENPTDSTTTTCSICFCEPIVNPTTIPSCNHTFCSTCLNDWQDHQKENQNVWSGNSYSCPSCRQMSDESVISTKLHRVRLLTAAGHLVDLRYCDRPVYNQQNKYDATKEIYYQSAMKEVNQILNSNPKHVQALLMKGAVSRHLYPNVAIPIFQELLEIDELACINQKKVDDIMDKIRVYQQKHWPDADTIPTETDTTDPVSNHFYQLCREHMELDDETKFPKEKVGVDAMGPFRLSIMHIMLAEAYEAAGKYQKAITLYNGIVPLLFKYSHLPIVSENPIRTRMVMTGLARCYYMAKDYKNALRPARSATGCNRCYRGIHKLLAQIQWALHEKEDAICTMKQGILYEAIYDEKNQLNNFKYLDELLANQ